MDRKIIMAIGALFFGSCGMIAGEPIVIMSKNDEDWFKYSKKYQVTEKKPIALTDTGKKIYDDLVKKYNTNQLALADINEENTNVVDYKIQILNDSYRYWRYNIHKGAPLETALFSSIFMIGAASAESTGRLEQARAEKSSSLLQPIHKFVSTVAFTTSAALMAVPVFFITAPVVTQFIGKIYSAAFYTKINNKIDEELKVAEHIAAFLYIIKIK